MPEQVGKWTYETYTGSSKVGLVLVHEVFGFDDYIGSVSLNSSLKAVFQSPRLTSIKGSTLRVWMRLSAYDRH